MIAFKLLQSPAPPLVRANRSRYVAEISRIKKTAYRRNIDSTSMEEIVAACYTA
jgi:hypothetical protein